MYYLVVTSYNQYMYFNGTRHTHSYITTERALNAPFKTPTTNFLIKNNKASWGGQVMWFDIIAQSKNPITTISHPEFFI